MKKSLLFLLSIVLTFNVMAANVWDGSSEPWTQGDGTMYNPYRIETAAQLAYLAEKVNEGYQSTGQGVLPASVSCSPTTLTSTTSTGRPSAMWTTA